MMLPYYILNFEIVNTAKGTFFVHKNIELTKKKIGYLK